MTRREATGPAVLPAGMIGMLRRDRATLMRCTALQAAFVAVLALPMLPRNAIAQPAPNARPTGGVVTGGGVTINQSSATNTQITQTTQRGAVDWRSFDVGSQQSVTFTQPGASAITLNRVTAANPSQIAGKIDANGQIVIVNQSGVVFFPGSQVTAQSVVVSAAGIDPKKFMAGSLAFDQAPKPGARIVNAGTLTAGKAGLVGLVAPSVANSGVINARMGHVVLAGAEAHTLDMYGDGLISLDVTRQVTTAPLGPDGKPVTALVTNTGLIRADGGSVQLTAVAADGLVQTLVTAGGTISARTMQGSVGSINIAGTGGSVIVDGALLANGHGAGQTGGNIAVNATGDVTAAAGARIAANGRAGGGTIALGTTLARAAGGSAVLGQPTARSTTVQAGARISANAAQSGNGGTVTLLSSGLTTMQGSVTAKGGAHGGNGGAVEISGNNVRLGGTVDVTAAAGATGVILLDPEDLTISTAAVGTNIVPGTGDPNIPYAQGGFGGGNDYYVTPAQLTALNGNVHLQAARSLTVASSFTNANGGITLEAGSNLTVNANATLSTTGFISLSAGVNFGTVAGYNPGATLSVLGGLSANTIRLSAPTGGVTFGTGAVTSTNNFQINTTGAITEPATGAVGGVYNTFSAASINLPGLNNFGTLFGATATTGNLLITNAPGNSIVVSGLVSVPSGDTIALTADRMTIQGSISAPLGTVMFSPSTAGYGAEIINSGTNNATPGSNVLSLNYNSLTSFLTAQTIDLGSSQRLIGPIKIGNPAQNGNIADTIDLTAINSGTTVAVPISLGVFSTGAANANGLLYVDEIHGQVGSLNVGVLLSGSNITTIGSLTATTDILVQSGGATTLAGPVSAGGSIEIETLAGAITLSGNVTGQYVSLQTDGRVSPITQTGGSITAGSLSVLAGFTFTDPVSLTGANQVTSLTQYFQSNGGTAYLNNARSLIVTNTQFGPSSTLNVAGDITISGIGTATAPRGTTFLGLTSTGAIAQTGTGALSVNTLSASGTSVALTSVTNAIGAISAGTASLGSFTVTDSTTLTVAGTITAANGNTIGITADTLDISNPGGALSVPNGTIALAPLTAGRAYNLYASGPVPSGASGFSIGNEGSLINASVLQIGSPTTGPITIAPDGNAVTFDGTNGVNELAVISGSSITQGASLAVPTLSGSANSVTLTAANTIVSLGSFTSVNGFTLNDAFDLIVTGPVSDNTAVALTVGGSLSLNGSVSSVGVVSLSATQGIGQFEGTVSAGTLTVASSGGAVGLNLPGNVVGTLGDSNALTALTITDGTSLTVGGFVNSPTIGLTVTGPLTIAGELYAPGGPVTLNSTGAIAESAGGGIRAGTLQGSGTSATLIQANNFIATLGSFTTSSGFALASNGLTVAGPVTDSTSIVLTSAGTLTLAGNIKAPTVALNANTLLDVGDGVTIFVPGNIYQTAGSVSATGLTIVAAGLISQTGGSLSATTLTGSATQTVSFLGAGNLIGTLGSFSSTGGFTFADAQALSVTGPLTDTASISLFTSAGGLTLGGVVNAPTVALYSAGAISQTGGSLVATLLTGSGASVSLGAVSNTVGTLGAFTSDGNFLLADATALTVVGTVSTGNGGTLTLLNNAPTIAAGSALIASGGTVVLAPLTAGTPFTLGGGGGLAGTSQITANELVVGSTNAGAITIAGAFNLANVPTLDLVSAAAITETAGAGISVNTLTATGSSITLGGTNAIATLGFVSTPGILTLNDTIALSVVGPVTATGGVSLTVAGALTFAGPVSTAGTADLVSTGAITQTGGSLVAATLTNNAVSTSLTSVTNLIGTLSTSTDITSLTLVDNTGLTVAGNVDPATVSMTVNGPLTIAAPIFASDNVALFVTGAISEAGGGFISTPLLRGSAASAAFSQGNDVVNTLGSFTTASGFTLLNATGLTVAGPVVDGASIAITSLGSLGVAGTIAAPSVSLTATNYAVEGTIFAAGYIEQISGLISGSRSVSLTADGFISQTGGSLAAGTLSGGAGGTVSLPATTNQVAALGNFRSVGGFVLTDARALTITGPVSDTAAIALTTNAGGMNVSGVANAPTITLNAAGAITQSGGSLVASLLTGSGAGVTLGSATNAVGTLGAFASSGNFLFADASAVTVSGTVSAAPGGTLVLANDNPGFAPTAALVASGGTVILEPLTAGDAITLGGGGGLAGTSQVTANTLVIGNPTAGAISIAGAFNLANVPTLDLVSASTITEANGAGISVATLAASGASITLGGTNAIATLGTIVTPGVLTVLDGTSLTVAGPVTATAGMTLTATGLLNLAGAVTTSGTAALTSTGAITQTGGSLTAATLNNSATSTSLNSVSNVIATLGSSLDSTTFTLVDSTGLNVTGLVDAASVNVTVNGPLTIAAPIVATNNIGLTISGAITENAGGRLSAASLQGSAASAALAQSGNSIATLGSFATTSGFALVDATALNVIGPVSDGIGIALTTTSGSLALAGGVNAPAVSLNGAGTVSQTGGSLVTALLSASGPGIALPSATNRIAAVGNLSSNGSIVLANQTGLEIDGPVTATTLTLTVAGGITEPGTISATTLTGTAASAAFTGSNFIANLGAFVATNGGLTVTDATPITINGPLSAPSIAVTATGSLVLSGGNVTTGNGLFRVAPSTTAPSGLAAISGVAPQSNLPLLLQTGTTTFTPLGRTGGTLLLQVPNGGSIQLADLEAPAFALTLGTGTGGTSSGLLNAGALLVNGAGGAANLFGTVGGNTGFAAAIASKITPAFDSNYLLNNCPIMSVSCTTTIVNPGTTTIEIPVVASTIFEKYTDTFLRPDLITLDLLTLAVAPDPDDPDQLLPNISRRDN